MFQELCKKIVLSGINRGYIEKTQKDEYLYGMNMFFDICVNIISMIIIGIVFKRLWECIVFCTVYRYMRKYTGGFHFESSLHCYISSCIMYFLFIMILKYLPFKIYENSAMVILSLIILWIISPVEAKNKPLEECEKQVFRKRARINIYIIAAIYITCLFTGIKIIEVLSYTIIFVMIFAIAGMIKNRVCEEK